MIMGFDISDVVDIDLIMFGLVWIEVMDVEICDLVFEYVVLME